MEIDLGARRVPVEVRISARARWMRVEVHSRGLVRLVLPAGADESRAAAFLERRKSWIRRHLARADALKEVLPDRKLVHGAKLPLLGRNLVLDLGKGRVRAGRLGDSLIVTVPTPTSERSVRAAVEGWYRREAREILPPRVAAIAKRHEIAYGRVVIRSQKSRWGSCSTTGTISLNWRLLLAPEEVVDYLLCHELAHRKEPNHSKRFWRQVERMCPGWQAHDRWLTRYGPGLVV